MKPIQQDDRRGIASYGILAWIVFALMLAVSSSLGGAEEPKKQEEIDRFLQFSRRGNVELQKTRGLLDVNGSFTVEAWVRWSDKSLRPQYVCGDFTFQGFTPDLPVTKNVGWVLEAMEVEDADKRSIKFSLGVTVKGKNDWFRVSTASQKGTDGKWHHVAVSKSPTVIRIFWNGKLAAEKNCKGVKFNGCPSDLYLGIRKGAEDSHGFEGDIRAFRAYTQAIYAQSFKPDEVFKSDEKADILLDFTGDDKEKIVDLSGKEHTGLLHDVKWVQAPKPKK